MFATLQFVTGDHHQFALDLSLFFSFPACFVEKSASFADETPTPSIIIPPPPSSSQSGS